MFFFGGRRKFNVLKRDSRVIGAVGCDFISKLYSVKFGVEFVEC